MTETTDRDQDTDQKQFEWECPECNAENTIPAAVVKLCVEHWRTCAECDNRVSFDFRGMP